jgi:hypothetical protein
MENAGRVICAGSILASIWASGIWASIRYKKQMQEADIDSNQSPGGERQVALTVTKGQFQVNNDRSRAGCNPRFASSGYHCLP